MNMSLESCEYDDTRHPTNSKILVRLAHGHFAEPLIEVNQEFEEHNNRVCGNNFEMLLNAFDCIL